MSIAICTPLSRKFDWRTVRSYFGFINDAHGDCEIMVVGNHERYKPIEQARCELAQRVLNSKYEWLLFFDSDATADYGTLKRLLSWKVPIVSALCFKRRDLISPAFEIDAYDPETFHPWKNSAVDTVAEWIGRYGQLNTTKEMLLPTAPEGSLLEVDRCGTHCLLIHRDVLEAIPEPRFERTTPPESGATGSDYDFCRKARRAGFPIHVDLSVIAGHLNGTHIISGQDFMMSTLFMNRIKHQYKMEYEKWHNPHTQEAARTHD